MPNRPDAQQTTGDVIKVTVQSRRFYMLRRLSQRSTTPLKYATQVRGGDGTNWPLLRRLNVASSSRPVRVSDEHVDAVGHQVRKGRRTYAEHGNSVSRQGRRSHGTRCGLSPGAIAPTSEPGIVEPAGEDELSPRVKVTMVAMRSYINVCT